MAIQVQGFSGVVGEVESATRALRTMLKPIDYGSLGVYGLSMMSGTMAAGLAADSSIFQFRWTHATNLCLINYIRVSGGGIAAFAAGFGKFEAMFARSYTANGTGGTAATITGNNGKLRTSTMGTTGLGEARCATTAALGAGTWTLDTQGFATLAFGLTATAGITVGTGNDLWNPETPGEYPVVFAQNEGMNIRATVPATGTWTFGVTVKWTELTAYAP